MRCESVFWFGSPVGTIGVSVEWLSEILCQDDECLAMWPEPPTQRGYVGVYIVRRW